MIAILNIIRIIYSHIIVDRFINIKLNDDIIQNISESHNTSNLNNAEAIMWIKYLKQIGRCSKWNEYQMYREWLYHKNLYKRGLFTKNTNYVDYEKEQTAITYILRIIGNCIY